MQKQDQILGLMEKLFDAKLEPIKASQNRVETAIYGNEITGSGLMGRMNLVENQQKSILAKFSVLTVFFGLVFSAAFEALKNMFMKKIGL